MEQTGATREEAVKALTEAKGDLVQAAMKLLSQKRQ
jgi:nascent polypeptide-associated complex subunit alpha